MAKKSAATRMMLKGTVRVDESVIRLVPRLSPGDVAVIEAPDLTRIDALALLGARPTAVLNAAASTTGRGASLGAQLLVENGVPLIDDLGADVMTVSEGEVIQINGAVVSRGTEMIATGVRRELGELLQESTAGLDRLGPAVESFAHTAGTTWGSQAAQVLRGEGLPLVQALTGRTVLVVSAGLDTGAQLRQLRAFSRDFAAFIIAEGPVASLVTSVLRAPDLIVGDISTTPEKLLRKGIPLVLLERLDGQITGGARATVLGLDHSTMLTDASPREAAILMADASGATQIITVGESAGVEGLLEQPASEAAANFFIATRVSDRAVSGAVAARLYRPGVRTWQLVLLVLAALVVLAAALFFTPWGGTWGSWLWDTITGVWPAGASQSAAAPPLW